MGDGGGDAPGDGGNADRGVVSFCRYSCLTGSQAVWLRYDSCAVLTSSSSSEGAGDGGGDAGRDAGGDASGVGGKESGGDGGMAATGLDMNIGDGGTTCDTF